MAIRLLNIILALAVFLSSAGFVVNKHYCQGEFQEFSLFVNPPNCHNTHPYCSTAEDSCLSHDHEKKDNCCDEQSDYHKLDQDQLVSSFNLELTKNHVLFNAIPAILNTNPSSTDVESIHHLTYRPPIVCEDIPVLLQTFLL